MSEYAVTDPTTGSVIESFDAHTDAEVADAVEAAHAAFVDWARSSSVKERADKLRRVAELHIERAESLADGIVLEMGKPRDSAVMEAHVGAAIFGYYADNAELFLADEPVEHLLDGEGTAVVRRRPLGPLLGIMPWNYPLYQVARFVAPNLAAGNTIVLKHAPQCPRTAASLQEIFMDAGFPTGAYVNIYASNEQVADVIADPRIQGISLTGSERAGAAVGALAGQHLKKVVLELGGSDPFVLLSTDDMDATVEAAVYARVENSGQACNAAKRMIVHESVYDEFLARFTERMLATGMSTLSSVAAAERIEAQVAALVAEGAELVTAGTRHGAQYPAGVLTRISRDGSGHRQELFGPVAMVFKVKGEVEAIEVANDTPFGLGSYLFTTDAQQADRVAEALDAGMVFINGVGLEGLELPFGGVKRSGFGRELGRFGLEEFVNKKLIRSAS